MLPTINLGAFINLKGDVPQASPRQRWRIVSLFSVFDVKQVFVSNIKMYDRSCEAAFNWLWLVYRI